MAETNTTDNDMDEIIGEAFGGVEEWKETLLQCEKDQLAECERIIKQGLGTFLDVGRALADIRDNRLYKATHKTFERYCKDQWDLGKAYANRQISGYEAVLLLEQKMAPIGAKKNDDPEESVIADKTESDSVNENPQPEIILPMNEAQARPLSKLTPDQQVEAWSLVLDWVNDGAKLTSYLVGKAAKQVKGETVRRKVDEARKEIEQTHRVSNLFRKQYNVLLTVISEERANGWRTTSKKDAVAWLKKMITIIDAD